VRLRGQARRPGGDGDVGPEGTELLEGCATRALAAGHRPTLEAGPTVGPGPGEHGSSPRPPRPQQPGRGLVRRARHLAFLMIQHTRRQRQSRRGAEMTPTPVHTRYARTAARAQRLWLVQLDEDMAALQRARDLLQQGRDRAATDPRAAFELVHRAALRGAGVLVTRANRERRRKLPLNVWTALDRIGGPEAERSEQLAPLVAERQRLD